MNDGGTDGTPAGPSFEVLISLYAVESGLIQQKASHILTIRSLAMATFTGVLAAIAIYPGRRLELLALIIVPFYVLDAVYDAYLIPIVRRETSLRDSIAVQLARRGATEGLVSSYTLSVDHRVTPERLSPFWRGALVPRLESSWQNRHVRRPAACVSRRAGWSDWNTTLGFRSRH